VNLGNPVEFTMRELAELIIAETGSSSELITQPLPQDDPKQRKPDISLAQAELGWAPRVSLQDGLKPTIKYFQERIGE
jgi:UDP-glucuronate decarboxylase